MAVWWRWRSSRLSKEKPDVVILGKQVVDGESAFVGQALASARLADGDLAATLKERPVASWSDEVDGDANAAAEVPVVTVVCASRRTLYSSKTAAGFSTRTKVRFARCRDHAGEAAG
jgi:electron transfer flavoprotein beta subunit